MTAAPPEAKDNKSPESKGAPCDASTDHKVATNQIADPAKLSADAHPSPKTAADSVAPATDVKPLSTDGKAPTAPLLDLTPVSPLLSTDGKLNVAATNPMTSTPFDLKLSKTPDFLSIDYGFYGGSDGGSCKVATPYTGDLFSLSNLDSLFAPKNDWSKIPLSPGSESTGDNLNLTNDIFTRNPDSGPGPGPTRWNAERLTKVNEATEDAFSTVFNKPGDEEKVAKFNHVQKSDLAVLLDNRKPGESWEGSDGSKFKATSDGGLVHRSENGDVEYYGSDRTFKKVGPNETWSYKGETIEKHYDDKTKKSTYRKIFGDGTSTEIIDDKEIASITRLENLTVTQHHGPMSRDRKAFDAAHNGVNEHSNGMDYVKDDESGDRLRKVNNTNFAVLKTKDGKFYAIRDGHVYGYDIDHDKFSQEEVPVGKYPPSLKRNSDGTLHFGTVSLSAHNDLTDSANGLKFKDRAQHIQAVSNGKPVDISVEKCKESLDVGDRKTVLDTTTNKLAITKNGKPDLDFDFNSRVLHSDGITFKPGETDVDGAFKLNENSGAMSFSDGSSWAAPSAYNGSDSYSELSESSVAQLHATVNEALALSSQISAPGSQNAVLAQLYSILGKLDGISGGVEIQAAVAASKGAVGGQILKAEAIGSMNDKLFSAGIDNSRIADAISRRGPGTTDDFIVQQMLTSDRAVAVSQ